MPINCRSFNESISGTFESLMSLYPCSSLFLPLPFFFQDEIGAAVEVLLSLKAEYKRQTGQEYKPGSPPVVLVPPQCSPVLSPPSPCAVDSKALYSKVAQQGEVVRKLKSEKASKVFYLWILLSGTVSSV